MKRSCKVALVVMLQILLLFGMCGAKYYTLHYGTPVLLRAAPVDPWDMFMGEYARLEYDITRVKDEDSSEGKKDLENETCYVVLEKGDKYWQAAGISSDRPAVGANQVVIKGKVRFYDPHNMQYNITYGIESYYVEEGKGREMERRDTIDVQVRVDRFGNAVIEKLL